MSARALPGARTVPGPELTFELPCLDGRILGLPGRVPGVGERVLHLGVVGQGGHHPRRLVTLTPGVLQLDGGLVALHAGAVKLGALLVARRSRSDT